MPRGLQVQRHSVGRRMTDSPIDAKLREVGAAIRELIDVRDANADILTVMDAENECKRLARELVKVVQEETRYELMKALTLSGMPMAHSEKARSVLMKTALPLEPGDDDE